MELVKKIIASILIICGIALAGIIICCGVMIAFPEVKIFGYSYLNTNSNEEQIYEFSDFASSSINIKVDSNDFDIKIVEGSKNEIVLHNQVFGFTKAADSERFATVDWTADYTGGDFVFKVNEPEGLFFTRKTSLTIKLNSTNAGKTLNVLTTTRKGQTTLGDEDKILSVNDLSCTCTNARGGVNLENVKINGNLNITNILGRINVKNKVNGTVTIDSAVGTYIFGDVDNLVVNPCSTKEISSPSITVENCGKLSYTAPSGNLRINGYLFKESEVKTEKASIYVETCLNNILFEGDDAHFTINQIGNFVKDSTSNLNSWDWKISSEDYTAYLEVTNGSIDIGTSYFPIVANSEKGKITIENALNHVEAISTSGSISVTFNDGTERDINSVDTDVNTLNKYINNNFVKYLDNHKNLDLTTEQGAVCVNNIRNSVNVSADSATITANFLKVNGESTIASTSKAIKVNAPNENFKLKVRMDKNSGAKIGIHFGEISVDSYDEDLTAEGNNGRVVKVEDDTTKGFDVRVAEASNDTTNIINITNKTGAISVQETNLDE